MSPNFLKKPQQLFIFKNKMAKQSKQEQQEPFNYGNLTGKNIQIGDIVIEVEELIRPRLIRLDILAAMMPNKSSVSASVRRYLQMAKSNNIPLFKLRVPDDYPGCVRGHLYYADGATLLKNSTVGLQTEKIKPSKKTSTGLVSQKNIYGWSSEKRSFIIGNRFKKLNNRLLVRTDYLTRQVALFKIVGEYIANNDLIEKKNKNVSVLSAAQKKHLVNLEVEDLGGILYELVVYYVDKYKIEEKQKLANTICREAESLGKEYPFLSQKNLMLDASFEKLSQLLLTNNEYYLPNEGG